LANHKSALKRAKQSENRRQRNVAYKTRVKRVVKDVRKALADNAPDEAQQAFRKAVSTIQKTASKGVIHRKTASRKISRLASRVHKLASQE
jgi:small subunit ribosomal protein S20